MGKVYKEIETTVEIVDKIICDHCGKELKKHMEEPPWFQSHFHLKVSWGDYYSEFDQQQHEAIVCEPCYQEIFRDVKVRVGGMGAPETFPGTKWEREDE